MRPYAAHSNAARKPALTNPQSPIPNPGFYGASSPLNTRSITSYNSSSENGLVM
ncbi:hypothetical protein FHR56_002123 [Xanthomonas sacchari]|nr:hypothetical protein [Xanthomonas sp. F10]